MTDPFIGGGWAKLVETVGTLGLGPLLHPWQMRREGKAEAHNHLRMKLAGAQADKFIEDIKAGKKAYDPNSGELVELSSGQGILAPEAQTPSLPLAAKQYITGIAQVALVDGLQRAENIAGALQYAKSDMIENTDTPVSNVKVDLDWFVKWRQGAEEVSRPELQEIWGKILAREVREPETFSLRTLDFVRNLSKREAELIERLVPFAFNGQALLWEQHTLREHGVTDEDAAEMGSLGVLSGGGNLLEYVINTPADRYEAVVQFRGGLGLLVKTQPGIVRIHMRCLTLSRIARELMTILPETRPPAAYIRSIARNIKTTGATVALWQTQLTANGVGLVAPSQIPLED